MTEATVVIPAHNAALTIEKCVKSCINQTLKCRIIIVLNSWDSTIEKVLQIKQDFKNVDIQIKSPDRKIRPVEINWNKSIEFAETKYVKLLCADDYLHPNAIEDQVNFLSFNPQAVAVGSQCLLIDVEGEEIGKTTYLTGCLSERRSFSFRCLLAHPSTMYLRSAALSIGGYRSKFRWMHTDIAEDFDFWLRLRTHGQIFNMSQNLTYYRVHKQQISSRFTLAQIVGTAYIAAGNISEINGRGIDKIDFSEGDYLRGLAKFESVLNNSPFMLHRIISRLQIRSLLNMSVAGNRIEKIATRILVKGLNFLFRVHINN